MVVVRSNNINASNIYLVKEEFTMAFFNFNLSDPELIDRQVRVLERKYKKHRNSDASQLEKERKIRAYVLEALVSYRFNGWEELKTHPAALYSNA